MLSRQELKTAEKHFLVLLYQEVGYIISLFLESCRAELSPCVGLACAYWFLPFQMLASVEPDAVGASSG